MPAAQQGFRHQPLPIGLDDIQKQGAMEAEAMGGMNRKVIVNDKMQKGYVY